MLHALERAPERRADSSEAADGLFQTALAERERVLASQTSLAGYLKHRVQLLGNWPTAATFAFWIWEIALGSVSGAWAARRMATKLQSL
jgi:hypothetical protein